MVTSVCKQLPIPTCTIDIAMSAYQGETMDMDLYLEVPKVHIPLAHSLFAATLLFLLVETPLVKMT